MLQQQELINSIVRNLSTFETEIARHNDEGRTDINHLAEDIIAPLLNEILQLNLVNLNLIKLNFPSIDLGDTLRRVAVQVTSNTSSEKITQTLRTFLRHGLQQQYSVLYIFALSTKKRRYNSEKINAFTSGMDLCFSCEQHLIDINFIYKEINRLGLAALTNIQQVLEKQMQDNMIILREKSYQNQRHQLDALRSHSARVLTKISQLPEYDLNRLDPVILPLGIISGQSLTIESEAVFEPGTLDQIIPWFWKKVHPHILLTGEGGAGKTSSLLWTWQQLLKDPKGPVPLYINLADAFDNGFSIYQQISDQYYKVADAADNFEKVIAKNRSAEGEPRVVILLDAFNQLSNPGSFQVEIERYSKSWDGVQFILASRHNGNFNKLQAFANVKLLPLQPAQIKAFVDKQSVTQPLPGNAAALLENPLRITMFFTYGMRKEFIETFKASSGMEATERIRGSFRPFDQLYNKGDLCHDFFESLIAYELIKQPTILADFLYTMLLKLIPNVAHFMESEGKFTIQIERLKAISFDFYNTGSAQKSGSMDDPVIWLVDHLGILQKSSSGYESLSFAHHEFRDYFSACYIDGIMKDWQQSVASRGFAYNSIPYVLKNAKLDNSILYYLGSINQEHRNVPLVDSNGHWSLAHYLHDSPLRKALAACKKKYNGKKLKNTVANLVSAMLAVKDDISGDSFTELWLKGIFFYGKTMSHLDGLISRPRNNQYIACSFEQSRISLYDFVPRLHRPYQRNELLVTEFYDNSIVSLYSEQANGTTYLYSGTKSEIIKWNLCNSIPLEKLSIPYFYDYELRKRYGHEMTNPFLPFCPVDYTLRSTGEMVTITKDNYNSFYVPNNFNFFHWGYNNHYFNENGWLGIWDIWQQKVNRAYHVYKGGWYCFGKNDQLLAYTNTEGTGMMIWDDRLRKEKWDQLASGGLAFRDVTEEMGKTGLICSVIFGKLVKPCAFHPSKTVILLTADDGAVFEWDYLRNIMVTEYGFSSFEEYILGYDPDGYFVLTSSYRYLFKNKDYSLTTDRFDFDSIKTNDFGRLGFWSTMDGNLKKDHDSGGGNEIITTIHFCRVPAEDVSGHGNTKLLLITGNKAGAIKIIDYDLLLPRAVLAVEVQPLYPLYVKYIQFSPYFITLYKKGLIKIFETGSHHCLGTVQGQLSVPTSIHFSNSYLKMAVMELSSSRIELWNLDNLQLQDQIQIPVGVIIWTARFNFLEDKLYVAGEIMNEFPKAKSSAGYGISGPDEETIQALKEWDTQPNVFFIYDLRAKQIVQTIYLDEWIHDWNFYVSPHEKTLLYISRTDTQMMLLHDLESGRRRSCRLPAPAKSVFFLSIQGLDQPASPVCHFSIIDTQNDLHFCQFDEQQNSFSVRTVAKDVDAFESINHHEQTINRTRKGTILLHSDYYGQPNTHQRYEYDFATNSVVKVADYKEEIIRDMILGEPYHTDRGYDYHPQTGCELVLYQDARFELYTIEKTPSTKRMVKTRHSILFDINVAACKFPFVYTYRDKHLRRIATILEENGAVFPLLYHFFNYPKTLQTMQNKNQLQIPGTRLLERIGISFGLLALMLLNWIARWVFALKKDSGRQQDPGNPYIHLPNNTNPKTRQTYFPSEKYEWD